MKKTLLMAIAIGLCSLVQAASWNITVGTNSVAIAPALSGYTAVAATNSTAYSAGDYVTMPNGRDYFCTEGGTYTTANAPTHRRGIETSDDSMDWYAIPSSRTELVVSIGSASDEVFVEKSDDATTTKSFLLSAILPARSYGGYRGELNAIVSSGTVTIHVEDN